MTPNTTVGLAIRYARDVQYGRIKACKFVRQSCRRLARDYRRSKSADSKYYFDRHEAERACRFIQRLPHTKGKWARGVPGEPGSNRIRLEGWQAFIVVNIFGWRRRDNGFRRFRRTYLEIPRKNGKSLLAAGIGLYMFVADRELGAEIYSGATSQDQAWAVFRPAHLICKRTPQLAKQFGISVHAKALSVPARGATFKPIIGKPGDGDSPHLAIVDEYHEHASDALYDTMLTGMGARDQPLMLVITTAGDNVEGPCFALRDECTKVLAGLFDDDEFFGIIYGIDKNDDWTSEDAILKANPNAGISVGMDYLRQQVRIGMQSPRKRGTVQTKHFGRWLSAADAFFEHELWSDLGIAALDERHFRDADCELALDVAYKSDVCSKVKVFHRGGKYIVFSRHYLPMAKIEDPANKHYRGWYDEGHLIAVPGNVNDLTEPEADLVADGALHAIQCLSIDPYKARHFGQHLQDEHGLPVIFYATSLRNMSEPMKTINDLILEGGILHDGNPVMNWMMSNVINSKKGAHAFPAKAREEAKIDGPVALIMAMGRWILEPPEEASAYESRGLLTV